MPSKEDILEFIRTAGTTVGKREISRHFRIKGSARIALKRILKEMAAEGMIEGERKRLTPVGSLPPVTVIEVFTQDADGELIARPANAEDSASEVPPRILVIPDTRMRGTAPGMGDRLLARIAPLEEEISGCLYEARPIKRLPRDTNRFLGIYRTIATGGGVIDPVDRKHLKEWAVSAGDDDGAKDGELVRFELKKSGRHGISRARVTETLGNPEAQGAQSLIAIHSHGLPDGFADDVIAEAESLKSPDLGSREDLRQIPLITIDPPDARDHDDAVWAAPDDDPENAKGWVVIVAIADVAAHVRPGTALDRDALDRGNSVYFPDRVVPMLPERISNNMCSLIEAQDRPCLAVRMVFDKSGRKRDHRFVRGMMRSAAKLSYQQAQSAIDGKPDDKTGPLLDPILKPLWAAYDAVRSARDKRAPLELDLPERKLVLDDEGNIRDVIVPERLAAHKLVEEFMIQANVAAAETLERCKSPLLYRVHDAPSKEKLESLAEVLKTFQLALPKSGVLKPEHFNHILAQTAGTPHAELAAEMVLRSQAQAEYNPGNYGHFGLNLRRYAHFTSPIRRYADLIVHRALIAALDLGDDGLTEREIDRLEQIAELISAAERRAMAAERETVDRLVAGFLAEKVGTTFKARISGVARPGLFVRLDTTGGDGFIPVSTIGDDYYVYDERRHAMTGERTGVEYRLGDKVDVRLVEAIPSAGALRFELLSEGRKGKPRSDSRKKKETRGRPYRKRRR